MLREIKRTVYTLSKKLPLDSLNQKMYMTYNNKDIDAYLYTISELIYYLFIYQISFYIICEQNYPYSFFVCNFFLCTLCAVYCQNRSVNIHIARNDQESSEPTNIGGM